MVTLEGYKRLHCHRKLARGPKDSMEGGWVILLDIHCGVASWSNVVELLWHSSEFRVNWNRISKLTFLVVRFTLIDL